MAGCRPEWGAHRNRLAFLKNSGSRGGADFQLSVFTQKQVAPCAWSVWLLLLTVLMLTTGCTSIAYYTQAIEGHLTLMSRRQPLETLIRDQDQPEALRKKLLRVQEAREFGSTVLGLPDNGSYRSYAPVEGDAVIWSLVATEALSIEALEWCYPVVGCATYRGYYDYDAALAEKYQLESQGFDVAVEPVPAYSTLGWFNDPLPSTVFDWPEWQIAGLMFHELAHQQLYIPGDSAFNEAYANQVQQIGTGAWLAATDNATDVVSWRNVKNHRQQFVGLLMETRERLSEAYRSNLPRPRKHWCKQALFSRLEIGYRILKESWNNDANFDLWFATPLNNARFASVATYEAWSPAFSSLYRQVGGDIIAFHAAAEALGKVAPEARRLRLEQLARGAAQAKLPMPELPPPIDACLEGAP